MKYRQAKKIIMRDINKKSGRRYYGSLMYASPRYAKAVVVYIHHRKKDHLHYYESRGILSELRFEYEKRRY